MDIITNYILGIRRWVHFSEKRVAELFMLTRRRLKPISEACHLKLACGQLSEKPSCYLGNPWTCEKNDTTLYNFFGRPPRRSKRPAQTPQFEENLMLCLRLMLTQLARLWCSLAPAGRNVSVPHCSVNPDSGPRYSYLLASLCWGAAAPKSS